MSLTEKVLSVIVEKGPEGLAVDRINGFGEGIAHACRFSTEVDAQQCGMAIGELVRQGRISLAPYGPFLRGSSQSHTRFMKYYPVDE